MGNVAVLAANIHANDRKQMEAIQLAAWMRLGSAVRRLQRIVKEASWTSTLVEGIGIRFCLGVAASRDPTTYAIAHIVEAESLATRVPGASLCARLQGNVTASATYQEIVRRTSHIIANLGIAS